MTQPIESVGQPELLAAHPKEASSMTEQPTPEQVREVLEAIWLKINPEPPRPKRVTDGCEWDLWRVADNEMFDLWKAKAWLSAAEMLVPEGWLWAIGYNGPDSGHPIGTASVFLPGGTMFKGAAATPALALAAAALRAHERKK